MRRLPSSAKISIISTPSETKIVCNAFMPSTIVKDIRFSGERKIIGSINDVNHTTSTKETYREVLVVHSHENCTVSVRFSVTFKFRVQSHSLNYETSGLGRRSRMNKPSLSIISKNRGYGNAIENHPERSRKGN